ncbi:MAG: hypothetical protein DRI61_03485 [Chloroflexi bacterium]|nr:MAG: hypothetical protein DRI61_03485 [Chloroflexota bacterium]HDN79139.1 hypothetical protein [Chloroflexota bacterium]
MKAQQFWKWVGILALAVLLGSFLWSFFFESLIPHLRYGHYRAALLDIVCFLSFPMMLIGLAMMSYGALILVGTTNAFQESLEFARARYTILDKPSPEAVREARRAIFRLLWKAYKPGLKWFVPGFIIVLFGAWLLNLH